MCTVKANYSSDFPYFTEFSPALPAADAVISIYMLDLVLFVPWEKIQKLDEVYWKLKQIEGKFHSCFPSFPLICLGWGKEKHLVPFSRKQFSNNSLRHSQSFFSSFTSLSLLVKFHLTLTNKANQHCLDWRCLRSQQIFVKGNNHRNSGWGIE